MKRKKLISITAAVALLFAVLIICAACAGRVNARAASDRSAASTEAMRAAAPDNADSPSNPAVYFTTDISPAGLMVVPLNGHPKHVFYVYLCGKFFLDGAKILNS